MQSEQLRGLMQELRTTATYVTDQELEGVMLSSGCNRPLEKLDEILKFWKKGSLDDKDAIKILFRETLIKLGLPSAPEYYERFKTFELYDEILGVCALLFVAGGRGLPERTDTRAKEACKALATACDIILTEPRPAKTLKKTPHLALVTGGLSG